jgi:hypothetical protein
MLYLNRSNISREGGLATNKVSKRDFQGQQIYVGMDVQEKSWSVSIFTDTFEHKTVTQSPEVGMLVNYLKRNVPGLYGLLGPYLDNRTIWR